MCVCVFLCLQCWENGIILCRELADQYESYYDYRNLSKMRVSFPQQTSYRDTSWRKIVSWSLSLTFKMMGTLWKTKKKRVILFMLCAYMLICSFEITFLLHKCFYIILSLFSLLDDGGLSLWQDHGPTKTRTWIFQSRFLWEKVSFLLTGKGISIFPLWHE